MAKKYIDVKCERVNYPMWSTDDPVQIPNPEENLIFRYHWFDTLYDAKAYDLGNFYEFGYIKDNEIVWVCENTDECKLKFDDQDKFMKKAKQAPFEVFNLYLNKHKKKDIEIIIKKHGFVIIYKDKYRFKFEF